MVSFVMRQRRRLAFSRGIICSSSSRHRRRVVVFLKGRSSSSQAGYNTGSLLRPSKETTGRLDELLTRDRNICASQRILANMIGRAAPQVWRLHGRQPTGHHLSIQIHIIQKWCFQPQNLSFAHLNQYLLNVLYSKRASQLGGFEVPILAYILKE